jgi:large subunit ribosomal protein L4e
MAAARPLVQIQNVGDIKEEKGAKTQLALPAVLLAPIRPDIVRFVHTNMAKNRRQAYAVSEKAGHQHSAESWGTGRAVARVPRVSGGGTSRAGQGAFANMCRKGRMYAPTKVWRKWHRKINQNQKRFAVASALAASAVPALVMARGHKIDNVAEVPLVVDSSVESITKTKAAIKALEKIGAYADVEKAKNSRKIRRGVGKMRNRRHVSRRGPLVVYAADQGVTKAFRNLPGVELANVERLNLLQLAPGGHLGRFIIWTRGAFDKLNSIYGSTRRESTQKKGYKLPTNIMTNTDVTRLINSDEVQSKVRAPIKGIKRSVRKKNPLVNLGALVKLNPYALSLRRSEILAEKRRAAAKKSVVESARAKNVAADKRTHEPQQRENYARLVQGETYVYAETNADGTEKKGVVISAPRASIKGVFPKQAKKVKAKKERKVKEVEVEEVAEKVESKGPVAKAVKASKVKVVKVKKEPKPEKPKKGAEAPKGEEGKKGAAAPKEEAKKAGGKGDKKK